MKEGEIYRIIRENNFQNDFDGAFSILGTDLAIGCYFSALKNNFNLEFPLVVMFIRNGIVSMYLPIDDYNRIGNSLAKVAVKKDKFSEWIDSFIKISDEVLDTVNKTEPKEFLANIINIGKLYSSYTAYQVATKTAFNFLAEEHDDIKKRMENARKYSENFFKISEEKLDQVAEELKKELNDYPTDLIKCLTVDEIDGYMNSKKIPSVSELSNRFKKSGIFWDGENAYFMDGDVIDKISKHWLSDIKSNIIEGQVAYRGLIRGKCRIILNYKEADIENGDILVTGMTDPNFVPLMKKAGAIVTDGGGLLCHAAIVARELKKPCIIGTKIATKVLKDGDEVEVDADKGVVKIIKRTE
jgi:phosphohistidine swiveling domain-containing protein